MIPSKLKYIKVNYRKYNNYLTLCTNGWKATAVGGIMSPEMCVSKFLDEAALLNKH